MSKAATKPKKPSVSWTLPQDLLDQRLTVIDQMRDAAGLVTACTRAVNKALEELQAATADYTTAAHEAQNVRDEIVVELRRRHDSRCENWQVSAAGGQFQLWVEAWEDMELSPYAPVDVPENLDVTVLKYDDFRALAEFENDKLLDYRNY